MYRKELNKTAPLSSKKGYLGDLEMLKKSRHIFLIYTILQSLSYLKRQKSLLEITKTCWKPIKTNFKGYILKCNIETVFQKK